MTRATDSAGRMITGVARRLLRPPSTIINLATQKRWEVDGEKLDADAQYVFMLGRSRERSMPDLGPERARRYYERITKILDVPAPEVSRTRALELESRSGPRSARAYYPKTDAEDPGALPGLVYFHGGGHTIGSIRTHDGLCRRLCAGAKCIVVSIDYRLAPEFPYPAAVEDCYDAYASTVARASKLGIDAERLAVGGDSAGGNLATVVASQVRESSLQPRAQLLLYPAVGGIEHEGRRNPGLARGFGLDAKTTRWFSDNYAPHGVAGSPGVAPLYLDTHEGLAPAVVATAHFDLLREEGLEYVVKLQAARVSVTHLHYRHLPHGFGTMSLLPRAQEAISEIADALGRALREN